MRWLTRLILRTMIVRLATVAAVETLGAVTALVALYLVALGLSPLLAIAIAASRHRASLLAR